MRHARLLAASLILGGCGILDFDVTQNIPPQTIPPNLVGGTLDSIFPGALTFQLDLDAQARAHDTGPIDSVHLKSIRLVIDPSSSTPNFDWLDELHVFIESIAQGSTLPKVEIAGLTSVPKGVTAIDLQVNGSVDVKPYVDQGPGISASGKVEPTMQETVVGGTIVFRVSPI